MKAKRKGSRNIKGEKLGAYKGASGYVGPMVGAQVAEEERELINKAKKILGGITTRQFMIWAAKKALDEGGKNVDVGS